MRYLLLIALLISTPIRAQLWDYIITSKAGTEYYIDPGSISKKDDVVTYLQILNYPKGYDSKNPNIHSIQQTKQINCLSNQSRTVSMIAYEKEKLKGEVLTLSVGRETKWVDINSDSILELYKNKVCRLEDSSVTIKREQLL